MGAPPPLHTLFITCQRLLSQTCFGTAGRVVGAGSALMAWREAAVINSFCSAWCLGQEEGDLCLFGKLGPNQFGACSLFPAFFKPQALRIVAEKGHKEAGYSQISSPINLQTSHFFPSWMFSAFQSVGIGQRTGQDSFKGGRPQRPGQPLLAVSGNRVWCYTQACQAEWDKSPFLKA